MAKTGEASANKLFILVLFFFIVMVAFLAGYKINGYGSNSRSSKRIFRIVNGRLGNSLTFTFAFPDRYLATSDQMVTDYRSEGGSAPPILFLTVNSQPLASTDQENQNYINRAVQVENNYSNDCILVWSTKGFKSIADWVDTTRFKTLSESSGKVGSYSIVQRQVIDEQLNVKKDLAFISLSDDISFFFSTCNANSKDDLQVVLQNFKVLEK